MHHGLTPLAFPSLPPRARRALTVVAAVVLAGVVGSGAAPALAGTIRHDQNPQAYLDLGSSPRFMSSGQLNVTRTAPDVVGSATLIDDNWVLTAAHLLDGATNASFNVGGREYVSDGWVPHPKWKGDPRVGFDLALVRLAEPVTNVGPTGLYRGKKEFGETATFVGFGKTGTGETGAINYDQLKRAGQNVIDGMSVGKEKVYTGRLKRNARIFIVDFDNPARPGDNVLGSDQPLDLEFLISHGDSGGGAFIDSPTGPLLAGIHSYGEAPVGADDSGYGDVTGHTRVSTFAGWVDKTIRRDRVMATPTPLFFGSSYRSLVLDDTAVVPEPATGAAVLFALGALALRRPGAARRR